MESKSNRPDRQAINNGLLLSIENIQRMEK
jgi:hypothetical protein